MTTSYKPSSLARQAAAAVLAIAATLTILGGMFALAHHYDSEATERLASEHTPVLAHHDTAKLQQDRSSAGRS